jgi:hypothetical protein
MNHINNPLLGRQIGEVYKWLCFLNYICLKSDKSFANRLDDIQYILEAVSSNKDRDISETAGWWERYYENKDCNEYAVNLIKNIRNAGRESRLNIAAHKRKSLSFYFAEFRGLAISLRSARDSAEHHVSQGENEDLFMSLYAAVALRIFEISKLLGSLVEEIALSNPDEVARFSLRIVTASESELQKYKELSQLALAPVSASLPSNYTREDGSESSASIITDLLDESEGRILEQFEALREEILVGVDRSRQEIIDAMTHLTSSQQKPTPRASDGAGKLHVDLNTSKETPLNRDQLFSELLELRGKIYSAMTSKFDGFEHWHNILQKPIIAEICRSGCQSYDEVKELSGFKTRIIQGNKSFALKEQEQAYAQPINKILSRLQRV